MKTTTTLANAVHAHNMRVVNKHAEKGTINIMRPGPFGNMFSHLAGTRAEHKVDTRDLAVDMFESRVRAVGANPDNFTRQERLLVQKIFQLPENAVLECVCKPQRCHGDAIVNLWTEMHILGWYEWHRVQREKTR